jgi:lipid-A-disaccharide synthase
MTFANEGVDKKSIKKVLIVTGEASGDLHGSNLVRAMREKNPNISFTGIGGDKMRKAGVKILVSSSDIAVVGLTEILSKIGTIIRAYLKIRAVIRKTHPDLVILIDNPGFNIRLARAAKVAGIPVFYYICPQLWAWGKSRVRKITQRVDRMAVILPFEKDFYDRMGKKTKVEYVGHPLMDSIPALRSRDEIRNSAGLKDEYPVIALVPGSRDHEITGSCQKHNRRITSGHCLFP